MHVLRALIVGNLFFEARIEREHPNTSIRMLWALLSVVKISEGKVVNIDDVCFWQVSWCRQQSGME